MGVGLAAALTKLTSVKKSETQYEKQAIPLRNIHLGVSTGVSRFVYSTAGKALDAAQSVPELRKTVVTLQHFAVNTIAKQTEPTKNKYKHRCPTPHALTQTHIRNKRRLQTKKYRSILQLLTEFV
jgi:hypothetical protein